MKNYPIRLLNETVMFEDVNGEIFCDNENEIDIYSVETLRNINIMVALGSPYWLLEALGGSYRYDWYPA